jgi:pimeloyl-ACP methyl ester carboxylesterase
MSAPLYRAIVPDLTGHGGSPARPEPNPFSFREDVAHVSALLAAGPPAHVVFHSYGAFVALLAAVATPASVRSLTLFGPVAQRGASWSDWQRPSAARASCGSAAPATCRR